MVARVESHRYWYCGCSRKRCWRGWTPTKVPLTLGTSRVKQFLWHPCPMKDLDRYNVEGNKREERIRLWEREDKREKEREREGNNLISIRYYCDHGFRGPTRHGGISALRNASMGAAASHAISTAPQRCFDTPNQLLSWDWELTPRPSGSDQ